jgi:hypothetical protein
MVRHGTHHWARLPRWVGPLSLHLLAGGCGSGEHACAALDTFCAVQCSCTTHNSDLEQGTFAVCHCVCIISKLSCAASRSLTLPMRPIQTLLALARLLFTGQSSSSRCLWGPPRHTISVQQLLPPRSISHPARYLYSSNSTRVHRTQDLCIIYRGWKGNEPRKGVGRRKVDYWPADARLIIRSGQRDRAISWEGGGLVDGGGQPTSKGGEDAANGRPGRGGLGVVLDGGLDLNLLMIPLTYMCLSLSVAHASVGMSWARRKPITLLNCYPPTVYRKFFQHTVLSG